MKPSTLHMRLKQMAASNAINLQHAREQKTKCTELESILTEQQNTVSDAAILLLTFLFLVFAFSEVLLSWEIYKELATQFSLEPPYTLVILFALMIIGMAIFTSWLLEIRFSKSLRKWVAMEKKRTDASYKDYPISEIENDIIADQKGRIILGYFLFATLVILISYLSFQRELMMSQLDVDLTGLNNGSVNSLSINYRNVLFPPLLVALEVITGVYLIFGMQRLVLAIKCGFKKRRLKRMIKGCRNADLRVYECMECLINAEDSIDMNRDTQEALYRVQHRSCDDFLEPVPDLNLSLVKNQFEKKKL